jgi:hypothetical protein
VALYIDSEEILKFLWYCDEYTFTYSRIMIQLTFLIMVCSFWGLLPGENINLSTHRGFNEGIEYGDITPSLARHEKTDSLIYQIVIVLQNRKFGRHFKSEEYSTPQLYSTKHC